MSNKYLKVDNEKTFMQSVFQNVKNFYSIESIKKSLDFQFDSTILPQDPAHFATL